MNLEYLEILKVHCQLLYKLFCFTVTAMEFDGFSASNLDCANNFILEQFGNIFLQFRSCYKQVLHCLLLLKMISLRCCFLLSPRVRSTAGEQHQVWNNNNNRSQTALIASLLLFQIGKRYLSSTLSALSMPNSALFLHRTSSWALRKRHRQQLESINKNFRVSSRTTHYTQPVVSN